MNSRTTAIALLAARAINGYEIGGLDASSSFPPNFQNITANECGVNDNNMQCSPDEIDAINFDQNKVKSPVRQLQHETKEYA